MPEFLPPQHEPSHVQIAEQRTDRRSLRRPSTFVPNRWDAIEPYYDAWGYVLGGEKTAQKALDDANVAIQKNLDKAWRDWKPNG